MSLKYKCTKCGSEFEGKFDAKCPSCGASGWDVEPVYNFGANKK